MSELHEKTTRKIAELTRDGDPLPLTWHSFGLELGLDVQAIIDNPQRYLEETAIG